MKAVPTDPKTLVPSISLDHPGWLGNTHGRTRRVFRASNTLWTAICEADQVTFEPAGDQGDTAMPHVDRFDPSSLPPYFHAAAPLRDNTCVQRVRNPDLWDALLPPIFRQRRGTSDATSLYRQFCAEHGTVIATKAGPALLPPGPEIVAELPDTAFNKLRIPDKRRPVRAAAKAYLTRASNWDYLSPSQLFIELQTVSHINTWTAGAIIADLTNDYSFYTMPIDVAYHQWNKYLASPTTQLPKPDFAQLRDTLNSAHRSTLNLLVLAAKHRQLATEHR